jgi:hypothetical protein
LKPALLGYFAGRIDPGKLSLLERAAIKMVKSPVGDFRDWDAVRDWPKKVAESMDKDTAGTSGENRKPSPSVQDFLHSLSSLVAPFFPA